MGRYLVAWPPTVQGQYHAHVLSVFGPAFLTTTENAWLRIQLSLGLAARRWGHQESIPPWISLRYLVAWPLTVHALTLPASSPSPQRRRAEFATRDLPKVARTRQARSEFA